MDKIAKTLIGAGATAQDLGSVESIAKALPDGGKEMMADLGQDANFIKGQVESQELSRIKQLSGL